MAAANPDRTALCRADGGLPVETATHGNWRGKSLGTKVRRQEPDPTPGPALASGSPAGALLYQSATGTRATPKVAARTTARPARRGGYGRNPTSEIRHPAAREPGLHLHRRPASCDLAARRASEPRIGQPASPLRRHPALGTLLCVHLTRSASTQAAPGAGRADHAQG